MTRFFFLPAWFIYFLTTFWVYTFFYCSLGYQVCLSMILVFLGYFFRRAAIPYRDTLKNEGEIFLSPVFGRVEAIRRDTTGFEEASLCHEIRISISGWDEKGLYLPTAGEVNYLKAHSGAKIPRKSDEKLFYRPIGELSHTDFILKSKNQTKTLMRFIDWQYGKRPTIWLKSGDRGRGAACFGFYPFGGTLLIYLPQNSDILVFEGEKVVPAQTVIAAIKDMKS
jgi:hypothetical protein